MIKAIVTRLGYRVYDIDTATDYMLVVDRDNSDPEDRVKVYIVPQDDKSPDWEPSYIGAEAIEFWRQLTVLVRLWLETEPGRELHVPLFRSQVEDALAAAQEAYDAPLD